MNWKVAVCLFGLLTISLFGSAANAQEEPKVDVFAGYSYVRVNPSTAGTPNFSLNGGEASLSYHVKDWLSGVADFGGYTNGSLPVTGTSGTLSTYLFGPRVSYRSYRRFTPFGEALFGVAHAGGTIAGGPGTHNVLGMAFGAGVNYRLTNRFSLQPLKVDYLLTRFSEGTPNNQTQNNLRASTGIVIHF